MDLKYNLNRRIPEEQKGGVSNKQETIGQLLKDSIILDHARRNK